MREKKGSIQVSRVWQRIIADFGSLWMFGLSVVILVAIPWVIEGIIVLVMGYGVSILKLYFCFTLPVMSVWALITRGCQDRIEERNYVGDPIENAIRKLEEWDAEQEGDEGKTHKNA